MSLLSQIKNKRVLEVEDEPEVFGDKISVIEKEVKVPKKKNKKTRSHADLEKEQIEQENEMDRLQNVLFGSMYSPIQFGKKDHNEEDEGEEDVSGGELPLGTFVDRRAYDDDEITCTDLPLSGSSVVLYDEERNKWQERRPAWVDEDDENAKVNIAKVNRLRKLRKEEDETVISGSAYVQRLRAQHAKLNRGTDWAKLDGKGRVYNSDEESDVEAGDVEGILRTNEDVVLKGAKLLPGKIELSNLGNIAALDTPGGPINSVQFHRNAQLLLAGGFDRKLRFFQIDGKKNAQIQTIFLEDCPIRKAAFLPDGSQVIVSGRRNFFYNFDLVKAKFDKIGPLVGREEKSIENFEVSPDSSTIAFLGNEGYILLVSAKSKQLIGTLKMNGTCRSLAFTSDGQQLLSSGGDGHIYRWDLRTRTCIHKGIDEGCLNGTSLCTSSSGNLFASGSSSGVVNIYNGEEFMGGKKKPLKTISNLTTHVDYMKFNHDSQLLAVLSNIKTGSLKLIHIPSFTVFSGWPPKNLGYARCMDFSPSSGFMAVGNADKQVLLYKLHHYQQA